MISANTSAPDETTKSAAVQHKILSMLQLLTRQVRDVHAISISGRPPANLRLRG